LGELVAERGRDLAGAVDEQADDQLSVLAEHERFHPSDRERSADASRVVEDRRAERGDSRRDVLVADRVAQSARLLELAEERVARRRRLLGERIEVAVAGVRLPLLLWLPRKERPRAGTHVQRQRSAEPQRKRP